MSTSRQNSREATGDGQECRHQWLIEQPSGKFSDGVCSLCGEGRQFQNYIENSTWGYESRLDSTSNASGIGGRRRKESAKALAEDE